MGRHAIIIGGGIAGPLSAIGLQRAGIGATVYEAYPQSAALAAGAWLSVAVNGLQAMRTLGVDDDVKTLGFPSEWIELRSGNGKRLGRVPIGGRLADGSMTYTLKRADLYGSVAEAAAKRGIAIEYGKRFVDAVETPEGVVARFDDNTQAHGDFLIGADGVHSRVRRLIDPAAPAPHYSGMQNIGGYAPALTELDGALYRMIFGKRSFFGYTVSPGGGVWWFANPPSARELGRDELAALDWRSHLLELFADDQGPMLEIIRNTPEPLVGVNQYDLQTVPRWQRGRLLILGDAAHAASPASGQGVSMAAEDAVALGLCMRDNADVVAGLSVFVAARRRRAERVVAYGRRYANMKVAGPIGRFMRDLTLPLLFQMQARSTGKNSLGWLFDHRLDWNARLAHP